MKILWVSLVEFPQLSIALGKTPVAHCGWLYSSAKALVSSNPEVELGVLVYSYGKNYQKIVVEDITYYLIPSPRIDKVKDIQLKACRDAIHDFSPGLIHIHGTEHSLAAAVCKANDTGIPMVANIQGLAIPYTRYADGGLSLWDKLTNISSLDFIRGTFLLNAKKLFKARAKCEEYVLKHVQHVVGRTSWDEAHTLAVNPSLNYHFMNETLRDSFYEPPIWEYNKCKQHSIFVSNSATPLKGAHQVIKALPYILKKFPDTIVKFRGRNVLKSDFKSIIRMQGYHLYLRRLVKKLNVQDHVEFLGSLTEAEMKQEFLNANVYVLPSSIENSPNSLCEAQILGVPTIAAYVGGTPDLVEEGKTGFLYRYEEVEMLSKLITDIFQMNEDIDMAEAEKEIARRRHSRTDNAERLNEIYRTIVLRK